MDDNEKNEVITEVKQAQTETDKTKKKTEKRDLIDHDTAGSKIVYTFSMEDGRCTGSVGTGGMSG